MFPDMTLPPAETPLYNHSLNTVEAWLKSKNCKQDRQKLNSWLVQYRDWQAEISMDVDEIRVRYINALAGNKDISRAFPYSLSRQDIEDAIFTGP
jgi:hypothetical protein